MHRGAGTLRASLGRPTLHFELSVAAGTALWRKLCFFCSQVPNDAHNLQPGQAVSTHKLALHLAMFTNTIESPLGAQVKNSTPRCVSEKSTELDATQFAMKRRFVLSTQIGRHLSVTWHTTHKVGCTRKRNHSSTGKGGKYLILQVTSHHALFNFKNPKQYTKWIWDKSTYSSLLQFRNCRAFFRKVSNTDCNDHNATGTKQKNKNETKKLKFTHVIQKNLNRIRSHSRTER
jgi:hypothetical protein